MHFVDVLKGLAVTIAHVAERAASDPGLQQAIMTIVVAVIQAEAAKKAA